MITVVIKQFADVIIPSSIPTIFDKYGLFFPESACDCRNVFRWHRAQRKELLFRLQYNDSR